MQQWKSVKQLHNLGKRVYAQKERYKEQKKKIAELERELHLYVLETMDELVVKYFELNEKISPESTVQAEKFLCRKIDDDDDGGCGDDDDDDDDVQQTGRRRSRRISRRNREKNREVIYQNNTDRFASLMYEIVHLLEQIELLPGGWNFFERPPYQQPVSHSFHNPPYPEYQIDHQEAEKIQKAIMRDFPLAVEAVREFRIAKKITAEDNAKLKKYESPPFPIKYTTTPWMHSAPSAKPDTRPLDWRNRLDWYSMKGVENEGMKGIENKDSSISVSLFHYPYEEIPSQWRSRGRMENLLANLQSAWRLLEELTPNDEDVLDLEDLEEDENQGDQWSCPVCRLNWTKRPPLQATCPGGEGMQGSSRSFGNLIKAKQHLQKSIHYLRM